MAARVPPIATPELVEEIWNEVSREYGERPMTSQRTGAAQPAVVPLEALLGQDGPAFVTTAYAAILHRAPDKAGAAYMQAQLAAGRSKILLLGQLRYSPEGEQVGVDIPGLRRRFRVHRVYALPLVGPVMRAANAVVRRTGLSHTLAGAPAGGVAVAESPIASDAPGRSGAVPSAARGAVPVISMADPELERQVAQLDSRLDAMEDSLTASLLALADRVAAQTARLDRLARLEAMLEDGSLATKLDAADALRLGADSRLAQVEATVAQNRQDVIDQQRRIGLMLEALRRRSGPVSAEELAELNAQDDHAFDSLYVAFEDRFRGTREDITQRQRFYLPILAEANAGSPDRPIVDVGCGRGEFLELMRDQGLTARGVDFNDSMAEACRALGLDAVAGDAVSYLAQQTPGSLGAVTGFHIIEHLPFKVMVRLFDEALRALAPGGVMIFETPNPANLLVGSRWFYMDPTHRNPLPAEMVAMIAEARGFTRISIVELHPSGLHFAGGDPVLRAELDRLFHGPQDYALLARKA